MTTYSVLFCGGSVVNRSKQASCPALRRVSESDHSGSDFFPRDFHGRANLVGKLPVGLHRLLASRVEFLVAALSTG